MGLIASTMIIILAALVNYLTMYQKNKIIADIIFMAIGGLALYLGINNSSAGYGILILVVGMISLIYDALKKN